MSRVGRVSPGVGALGAGMAVAAGLVVVARWLPLSFAYRPNGLGIVSATTRAAYPTQQEPILFLAFGAVGVLTMWLASGLLSRRRFGAAGLAAFEAAAFAALAGALLLPTVAATAWVAVAMAVLVVLFRRSEAAPAEAPAPTPGAAAPEEAAPPAAPASPGRTALLALALLAIAVLRVPRLLQALEAVAVRMPDERLTRNNWVFLSEDGQHLAWADALLRGGLHGRDFFCLYGPLYDWSVVWLWKLVGRSIAAWHLHVGLTEALAWLGFLALGAWVLRRRWLLLVPALLVPHLALRIGLGFASLFFLLRHGREGRPADALAAGLVAGGALLYSQEFGAAAIVCAGVVLAVRPSAAGIGAYAGGVVLAVVPVLAYYAAHDALAPMAADVIGYPGMLMAGFGNLPFPSLRASLPLPLGLDPAETRLLRLFYAVPAVTVVALGVTLPRRAPHPRSPVQWLRDLRAWWAARPRELELAVVALFGLAAFRTALGRSDQIHLYAVAAPAILLATAGLDRLLDHARARPGLVAGQAALGALLLFLGGFVTGTGAGGWFHLRNTADTLVALAGPRPVARGSGAVNRVVAWLEENAAPDDRFYFLPNEAALYYLTARPAPTRFVVSHQMVTQAHRDEALADLRAAPPRYVVWNDASLRLDGIGDETILGPALWDWLHAHYRPVERLGGMRIWEWAGAAPEPSSGTEDHSR